jgi:hypothetical protein
MLSILFLQNYGFYSNFFTFSLRKPKKSIKLLVRFYFFRYICEIYLRFTDLRFTDLRFTDLQIYRFKIYRFKIYRFKIYLII